MHILKLTKYRTSSLIIVIMFISFILGYIFLKYQFSLSADEQLEKNYKSVERLFYKNIKHEKEKFKLELRNLVSSLALSKAVAKRDYSQINAVIARYYIDLKRVYPDIKILTFRSSDGTVLYRAHKPEFYGDKISKKRELIVSTNKFQKPFTGFEIGKLEFAYRVTSPIFYKNRYVGSVELGLSPVYFVRELKTIFDIDTGISIKKSLLDRVMNQNSISIDNKYALINADTKLLKSSSSKNLSNIKLNIALLNLNGKVLGYLLMRFNNDEIIHKNNIFIYRFFGLILIMMLIVGFLLHQGFKSILNFFTQQISIDQLSGLKNRMALTNLIHLKEKHVLILSDIKDFSFINELYGVDVGNEVLKQVSTAFEKFANKHDFKAFRIASDEYVLYKKEDIFDADDYNDILEALHKDINALEIFIEEVIDVIKIDINSGLVFDDSNSLEKAQMALKKAKGITSSFIAYSKNIDTKEKSEFTLKIRTSIRHGLNGKNIIPFFQPITNNQGQITKYEALIRIIEFKDGKKSIIFPDSFIEISKQNTSYTEISKIMIEKSLSFFKNRDEKISINISPGDLFNVEIMDTLIENIKKFDTPSKIVVEITEQDGIVDFDRFVHGIKRLKRLGVMLAIDDFGSGYANYAHILVIKPDYLKIDGSLVTKILQDDDIKILIRSIILFAKELNIKIIAEYIENKEIFELLKEYGVDEFQGYYFGKPTDLINETEF
jgi:EAL domain-containing protein (putative c-di-GMP-specific phosphodiesterase class I)/GGDEF domain-containing protein